MSRVRQLVLRIDPDDLLAVVAASGPGVDASRRVHCTLELFDTPEAALGAQGVAMVVCPAQAGDRSVSLLRCRSAGKVTRCDAGSWSDGFRLPDRKWARKAFGGIGAATLVSVARAEFDEWPIRGGGGRVAARVVRGQVASGDRRVPVCGVIVEARASDSARLFRTAYRLSLQLPIHLDGVSPVGQGMRLADPGRALAPVHAGKLRMARRWSAEQALTRVLVGCLDHAQGNIDPVLLGEDIEGVHQMRVGLRRFRAGLGLFRNTVSKSERRAVCAPLRPLLDVLGQARDWDVFCAEHAPAFRERFPGADAYERLLEQAEAIRDASRTAVRDTLRSPECAQAWLSVRDWIHNAGWHAAATGGKRRRTRLAAPARQFAADILERGHQRIRARRHLAEMEDRELHALRIDIKKQRYAVEFFASLFPAGTVKPYRNALRAMQEQLGWLNDAVTMHTVLIQGLEREGARPDSLAILRDAVDRAGEANRRRIPEPWKRFRSRKPFWRS